MSIFMTGGSGFLGKTLALKLAQSGNKLKLLLRKSSHRKGLDHENIEFCEGDVTDRSSVRRGMQGCDKVIHSAALVRSWVREKRIFDEINVQGFKNVIETARELNVSRIVYTSSFMALGPSDDKIVTEEDTHKADHFHNDYERTKYLADCCAKEYIESGVPLICVYPGVIYGPGELTQGNIVATIVIDFVTRKPIFLKKVPGLLGDGTNRWSYSHVNDVAEGHVLALEKGRPGERYILGGDNRSMNEFMASLGRLSGLEPPKLHFPFWVGKVSATVEELLAVVTGREPFNTRGTIEVYKHAWAYSSAKAERELGYKWRSLESGLTEVLEWIKREKLVANWRRK